MTISSIRYALPVMALVATGYLFSQESGDRQQAKGAPKGGGLIRPLADVEADLRGKLERIKVHGKSLEGNLEGDSPDREVFVYLPPSYAKEQNRRYPVVYLLHGYGLRAEQWVGFLNIASAEKNVAAGTGKEMILVMPDGYTLYNGAMYSSSPTTGDWENFLVDDLVRYVDSHYRTIANRDSRGLAGHSMGGYGTMRLGMKHPEVYSNLYAMSSCCLIPNMNPNPDQFAGIEAAKTPQEAKTNRGATVSLASAAAWSPDPNNPPFFLDLPVKDGKVRPEIIAKWAANAPLAMVDQYAGNLKKYKAIALDVGLQDGLLATNQQLDALLTLEGVKHTFETYEGDHNSKVPVRFDTRVIPFFSNQLSFKGAK